MFFGYGISAPVFHQVLPERRWNLFKAALGMGMFFFLMLGMGTMLQGFGRFSLSHLKPQPRWEWNNGMDQEDQVILSLRG